MRRGYGRKRGSNRSRFSRIVRRSRGYGRRRRVRGGNRSPRPGKIGYRL